MYCNCNTANDGCTPCAICTPPGVTGLTTCIPPDPCPQKLDIQCVTYNGTNFSCINVATGDGLIDVLLNILAVYFPEENCCTLAGTAVYSVCGVGGEVEYYITTTTSTTSTTTTTTTLAPECNFYQVINLNESGNSTISYVPCNSTVYVNLTVVDNSDICVNNSYPILVVDGSVSYMILSACNTPAPPTTTTTTAFSCTCTLRTITNTNIYIVEVEYIECQNGDFLNTVVQILPGQTITACVCTTSVINVEGVVVVDLETTCLETPTTTTSTSTTTTTTCAVTSTAYVVTRYNSYEDYCSGTGGITVTVYTGGGFAPTIPTYYWHAYSDPCMTIPAESIGSTPIYVYLGIGYIIDTASYLGGVVYTTIGNPVVPCTTTTTTMNMTCRCYSLYNATSDPVRYSYMNCSTFTTVYALINASETVNLCAVIDTIIPLNDLTITDHDVCGGELCPTTTTSTTTTTAAPCKCYSIVGFAGAVLEYTDCSTGLTATLNYTVPTQICAVQDTVVLVSGSAVSTVGDLCVETLGVYDCPTTTTSTTSTTSTTTTTTICPDCYEAVLLDVTVDGFVSWLNCYGEPRNMYVTTGGNIIGSALDCVQGTTITSEGAVFTISGYGPSCCVTTTTTTTVAPEFECISYQIYNETINIQSAYYEDCTTLESINIALDPFTGVTVCSRIIPIAPMCVVTTLGNCTPATTTTTAPL